MRSCHNLSAGFDDPNLVSCAGLIPVMTLAERAGLHDLARTHVRVPGSPGANADVKVAALVAGMVAGADTIDAMDLLRHGGMGRVFTPGRAAGAQARATRLTCGFGASYSARSPEVLSESLIWLESQVAASLGDLPSCSTMARESIMLCVIVPRLIGGKVTPLA